MDEEHVEGDFKTKKAQVEYLLRKYPQTRDNDFYLQYMWMKTFGRMNNLPFIDWNVIKDISGTLETISRVRRKIQNEDHRYLPSEEVQRQRDRKRRIISENITRWR